MQIKEPATLFMLEDLVSFLNFSRGELRTKAKQDWVTSPVQAARLQSELRSVLTPLTNRKHKVTLKEAQALIGDLVGQFSKLEFSFSWSIGRYEYDPALRENFRRKKTGAETVGLLKNKSLWRLMPGAKRWTLAVVYPDGKEREATWRISSYSSAVLGMREHLYWSIFTFLEDGNLDQLRSCPECQRFFVADDPRQDFCIDRCRIIYNNKLRLTPSKKSGVTWFTEHRRKRKKAIEQARELRNNGMDLDDVAAKTGLSTRVLKQAGLT